MSLSTLIDNAVRRFPDRIALEDDNRSLTYRHFHERTSRLGQALLAMGIKAGDTVAALLHNSIELVEFDAASTRFGFVRTAINIRASETDQVYCMNFAAARVLVFEFDMADDIDRFRVELNHVEAYICVGGKLPWAFDYEELLEKSRPMPPATAPGLSDRHSVYFTSGTTGRPKGVQLTHANWTNIVSAHLRDFNRGIQQSDVGLLAAPITHASGSLVFPHFSCGAKLRIIDRFDPEKVLDLCAAENITSSFMAPTMIQMLMQHIKPGIREKLSFRALTYGGAPFPVHRLEEALEIFGPCMVQLYGQWEAPIAFSFLGREDHADILDRGDSSRLHSAGHATTFAEIGIMDDDGNLLGSGETGEIVTAGTHLMLGYLNNEEATSKIRQGKWQRTGDVGHLDEFGYLYITDRKNDMIISGGNNIYPRQIEEIIYQHPEVVEACAVGLLNDRWGETVHLVAVVKAGSDVTVDALLGWARDRLPTDRRPRSAEIIGSLPKNNYGKILRREVRDDARGRLL